MSGKVIMKRKREEPFGSHNVAVEADSSTETSSIENETPETNRKRSCPEEVRTSAPAPVSVPVTEQSPELQSNARNELLLEALQRIVELQNELDEFEQDLDEDERYRQLSYDEDANISMYDDEPPALRHEEQIADNYRRNEAEALGFAMCARETLLFLQREGISRDSLLYRSLRSKLVGQTDGFIPI